MVTLRPHPLSPSPVSPTGLRPAYPRERGNAAQAILPPSGTAAPETFPLSRRRVEGRRERGIGGEVSCSELRQNRIRPTRPHRRHASLRHLDRIVTHRLPPRS